MQEKTAGTVHARTFEEIEATQSISLALPVPPAVHHDEVVA